MIARSTLGRDEMATWQFAHLSVPDLVRAVDHVDAVLAPYYLFVHLWTSVSDSAGWMRLPSALAVAAAVALVARYAARTWGPGAGVLTGCALAFHPTVVAIAVEARPYALALAFCTWGTILVLEPAPLRRRRYVVVMAVAVAMHLFALMAVFAHLVLARRRDLLLPSAAVGAAAVPMALYARTQKVQVSYIPEPTVSSALRTVRDLALPGTLLWISLVAAVLLAIAARRDPRARTALLAGVALVAVPAVLLYVASHVSDPVLSGRYLITAPLGVAVAVGALAGLGPRARWWPAALVVALLAVLGPDVRSLHAPRINGADFPGLARALEQRAVPGDELRVVIRTSQGGMPAGVALYTHDDAFLADILRGLPGGEPLTYRRTITGVGESVPQAGASRTVWLVAVYGTKPALDAASSLRREGCEVGPPQRLGELALYRGRCAAPYA